MTESKGSSIEERNQSLQEQERKLAEDLKSSEALERQVDEALEAARGSETIDENLEKTMHGDEKVAETPELESGEGPLNLRELLGLSDSANVDSIRIELKHLDFDKPKLKKKEKERLAKLKPFYDHVF